MHMKLPILISTVLINEDEGNLYIMIVCNKFKAMQDQLSYKI